MSDQAQNSAQALTPYQQHRVQVRDSMAAGVTEPMAIVPRNYGELAELCGALASSTLVPAQLRDKAPNIMVILMNGAELGMPPMQALRLHHVIEGVPRLSAEGMAAVVTRSAVCEYFECLESSEIKSVWRTKRVGRQEQTMTWTIERARRAGLAEKATWKQHPGPMLNSRCKAELARMVYPDVVAGMIAAEEARDGDDFAEPPSRGTDFEAPPAPAAPGPQAAPTPSSGGASSPAPSRGGRAEKASKATTGKVVEASATERPTTQPSAPSATSSTKPVQSSASTTSSSGSSGSGSAPASGSANPPAAAGSPAQSASPQKNVSAPSAATESSPALSNSSAPAGSTSDPTHPSSASPPRSATEGSSATSDQDAPRSESTVSPSSFAAGDLGGDDLDSGFGGDEPEPEEEPAEEPALEPPTSITQFSGELAGLVAKLRTEPIASAKATELGLLKSRWMAWSEARVKDGKDGHADVKRMRGEFSAAVTELGLR